MTEIPKLQLLAEDVPRLYGKQFYITEHAPAQLSPSTPAEALPPKAEPLVSPPQKEVSAPPQKAPGINWRPKDSSKVLFILHQSELKNKVLTDLLKQIVQAIEIPFPSAGFGIVTGEVQAGEFDNMPNPYGIVFDESLLPSGSNPYPTSEGEIFFTMRLKDLQHDRNAKRALWEFLKSIKPKL